MLLRQQNRGIAKIVDEKVTSVSVHSCLVKLLLAAADKGGNIGLWDVQHAKKLSKGAHTFQVRFRALVGPEALSGIEWPLIAALPLTRGGWCSIQSVGT